MDNKQDNINIKQEITFEEKLSNFFEKIAFLELKNEEKQKIAIDTKEFSKGDKLYWLEIFLSASIAALGLIQNSVAVIIGAMLLAPLLRPINGIAFGISSGEKKALLVALRVLIISILASIFMGYILSYLVAISVETSEIIARTSPNILDFFIAIFSAFVAILSLQYSRLGESVAGVAMAASLLPPLAVVGIELYLTNYYLAWSSFMLFATNLFAIILVGIMVFLFYGFYPHKEKNQKIMIKNFLFIIILITIISVPLFGSLLKIKENIIYKQKINNYLEKTLKEENEKIEIFSLEIEKNIKQKLVVKSVIKIPENVVFYKNLKETIVNSLSKQIGKDVDLKIELIRTANIISKETIKKDNSKEIISYTKKILNENISKIHLINIILEKKENIKKIKIVYSIPKKEKLEQKFYNDIEKNIKQKFPGENIIFNWLPLQEYNNGKDIKELKQIFSSQQELINDLKIQNEKLQKELIKKVEIEKNIVKLLNKYVLEKNKK